MVGGGEHSLQTGEVCMKWATLVDTNHFTVTAQQAKASLPHGRMSQPRKLSSQPLWCVECQRWPKSYTAWQQMATSAGQCGEGWAKGPGQFECLHLHCRLLCIAPFAAGLGTCSSIPAWYRAVLTFPWCTHGTRLHLVPAVLLSAVHSPAQKARWGFVPGEGRHLLFYASGAEGISLIPRFVPQKPLCLFSVSFSECHAARCKWASTSAPREEGQVHSFCWLILWERPVWLAPSLPSGHMDSFLGWRGRGGVLWYNSFPSALGPFFPHPSHLHRAMMMRDTAESMLLCSETVQGIKPSRLGRRCMGSCGMVCAIPSSLVQHICPQLEAGVSPRAAWGKGRRSFQSWFPLPFCSLLLQPCWASLAPLLSLTDSPYHLPVCPDFSNTWPELGSAGLKPLSSLPLVRWVLNIFNWNLNWHSQ